MVLDQVAGGDGVNLERLVSVEGVVAQREEVKQLSPAIRAQVEVLRDVKEKHEVVLVLGAENYGAHVFDHVKAGLLVDVAAREFERVDVLRRLNVNSFFLLRRAARSNCSQLLSALRVHDHLV